MGQCAPVRVAHSTDSYQADEEIDKIQNRNISVVQAKDKAQQDEIFKLLLLGPGESGKSTLFKQCIHLYGAGFTEAERSLYAAIVYSNILSAMKTLITQSIKLDTTYGTRYSPSLDASATYLLDLKLEERVDDIAASHIQALWNDIGIQKTFKIRALYQLNDACHYFFQHIDRISSPTYVPSYDDVLRSRARTTGMTDTSFILEGNQFRLLDIGGQRNERRKWLHCFQGVTAVIFVAAINEYDQYLFEDGVTNRIHESLTLFEKICTSEWLLNTSMILFLNKYDLFAEKIQHTDITMAFPEYTGGCDYETAARYITQQFLSKNLNPSKQIYPHLTCATDTSNINFTFRCVKNIILKSGLRQSGLLT